MKKLLFLFTMMLSPMLASAYRPFVVEGKRWECTMWNEAHVTKVTYTIQGDTVINNQPCKKLYVKYEYDSGRKTEYFEHGIFEQERKVYTIGGFQSNTALLLYDFSLEEGDVIVIKQNSNDWWEYKVTVLSVDTIINSKKQPFRRMLIRTGVVDELGNYVDKPPYTEIEWIEGIGSSRGPKDSYYWWNDSTPGKDMDACYEDGECIFTADDFNTQTDPKPAEDMAYRPFVEDGKVWKVGNTQTILDNVVQVVDYYYFDGDTTVGGKTCKQMMCQRHVSPDYSNEYWTPTPSLSKVGAWYEEDKKVYFYDESKQAMVMKYDFSLAANDTLQFLTDWSSPFIIGPKQTGGIEGFKGVYRDIRMCGDEGKSYHDTFWLEGVGCIRGPISSPCNPILGDPKPEFLMSCTVGDEVIYHNEVYEDGVTPEAARKQRIDFTHTIKIKPQSRTTRGAEASLYGEYNDQQLGINLNALDDAYQVRITDESGKAVYEKTVNAGNIVGLNINISDYAESRYTVTVENSNESFTAQFDTHTTEIVEVRSKREEVSNCIYNFQGQRISSLRKGLNIVNGRKVCVK